MYNKEEIYNQALKDPRAIVLSMPNGTGIINNGVKLQKFPSKIEIINLGRSSNYYVECGEEEYAYFYKYGWKEGAIHLAMDGYKRKLLKVEESIKQEVNTRKNNKHIQTLKTRRETLLNNYAEKNKQLNQINTNGKQKQKCL